MDDDDERDLGLAFAIPDLYAPSGWLKDVHVQQPPGLIFAELTLEGLESPPFV